MIPDECDRLARLSAHPVFVVDETGRIVCANPASGEALGFASSTLVGRRLHEIADDPREKVERVLRFSLRSGEPVVGTLSLRKKEGTLLAFPYRAMLIRPSAPGRPALVAIQFEQVMQFAALNDQIRRLKEEMRQRRSVEQALRKTQTTLAKAQEIAHLGSWELDLETDTLSWSDEVYRIFGHSPQTFGATNEAFLDCVHPEDRAFVIAAYEEAMKNGTPYDLVHRVLRPDGDVRVVHERSEEVRDATGKAVRSVGIVLDVTERKRAEETLIDYQKKLRALTSELTLTEERLKRSTAELLHDDIGQLLAFLKMKVQLMREDFPEDPLLDKELVEVRDTLTDILRKVQSITFELSSPILSELGLERAIAAWLKETVEAKHGIHTEFSDDGQPKSLSDDLKAILFRSTKELLNNAVKHARPQSIKIHLSRRSDQITITVTDDGQGFDPQALTVTAAAKAFGLFSVRERLDMLGGALLLDSAPGRGCVATLRVPLTQVLKHPIDEKESSLAKA